MTVTGKAGLAGHDEGIKPNRTRPGNSAGDVFSATDTTFFE
jgi:hypothetical protein